MENLEKVAEIAAEWWSNIICKPKHDNGDTSLTGFMTMGLLSKLVKDITEEQKNDFKNELKERIIRELQSSYDNSCWLDVDYHPNRILSETGNKYGIPEFNFPIKTNMHVNNEAVIVSYGYGSKYKPLFATNKYYEKLIESRLQSIQNYKNREYGWLSDNECEERIIEINKEIEEYRKEIEQL